MMSGPLGILFPFPCSTSPHIVEAFKLFLIKMILWGLSRVSCSYLAVPTRRGFCASLYLVWQFVTLSLSRV